MHGPSSLMTHDMYMPLTRVQVVPESKAKLQQH